MTARVHEPLAGVDLSEVKISNHVAFADFDRSADDTAVRVRNGGEAAARYRPDGTTRILDDLGLLVGIEPRRRTDYEASRLESVLTDVSFRLLRE
jgi:hypothetical protein